MVKPSDTCAMCDRHIVAEDKASWAIDQVLKATLCHECYWSPSYKQKDMMMKKIRILEGNIRDAEYEIDNLEDEIENLTEELEVARGQR